MSDSGDFEHEPVSGVAVQEALSMFQTSRYALYQHIAARHIANQPIDVMDPEDRATELTWDTTDAFFELATAILEEHEPNRAYFHIVNLWQIDDKDRSDNLNDLLERKVITAQDRETISETVWMILEQSDDRDELAGKLTAQYGTELFSDITEYTQLIADAPNKQQMIGELLVGELSYPRLKELSTQFATKSLQSLLKAEA
jgi:hypothetical protein